MGLVKVEILKAGKEVVAEWMARLIRVCMKEGRVHEDRQEACLVPIYKENGDGSECVRIIEEISFLVYLENCLVEL